MEIIEANSGEWWEDPIIMKENHAIRIKKMMLTSPLEGMKQPCLNGAMLGIATIIFIHNYTGRITLVGNDETIYDGPLNDGRTPALCISEKTPLKIILETKEEAQNEQ